MRQVVLDTETTGLEVSEGHRLIEIGCVELVSRRPTGRHFHRYLNPEREIDVGATEVHGFTLEKLQGEPRFADIVEEFLAFVEGAELIIHNAPFDLGFLNAELGRWCEAVSRKRLLMERQCTVVDTLALARSRHPGQRNSLDALCKRYGVDNARRDLHGALLDAEILAEVYLAMTGGQSALELKESISAGAAIKPSSPLQRWVRPAGVIPVIEPSPEELALHEALMVNVKS